MRAVVAPMLLLLLAACGSPGVTTTTPTPVPTAPPSATSTRAPVVTRSALAPSPDLLAFPPNSGVALDIGRYSSQPPFDLAFSFEIAEEGWATAHHHADFLDVIQPVATGVLPTRWVAFARPQTLHGTGEIDAAGLTPADVVAAFESRGDIDIGESTPYEIGGLAGLSVDISTDESDVKPFGGPGGDFELDPSYDGRMVVVSVADAPLLVLVLAPEGQLQDAWANSEAIVDSITW
jgi:hypothetical protein